MSTQSEKNIGVAVIGCGGRGTGVTRRLLQDSKGHVKVLAVYDPDEAQCRNAMSDSQWKSPDTKICKSYQEAIATPGVDWVMVFSPNAYHKEGGTRNVGNGMAHSQKKDDSVVFSYNT